MHRTPVHADTCHQGSLPMLSHHRIHRSAVEEPADAHQDTSTRSAQDAQARSTGLGRYVVPGLQHAVLGSFGHPLGSPECRGGIITTLSEQELRVAVSEAEPGTNTTVHSQNHSIARKISGYIWVETAGRTPYTSPTRPGILLGLLDRDTAVTWHEG